MSNISFVILSLENTYIKKEIQLYVIPKLMKLSCRKSIKLSNYEIMMQTTWYLYIS